MMKTLFLQKIINRLPTVAAEVGMHEGDVYPVRAVAGVLPDELIKVQVGLDVIEPPLALLHVATDAEVCRLPSHVLRVRDTTDGTVELFAAEAAGYGYRFVHRLAERFEHITGQIDQRDDLLHRRLVVYPSRLGRSRCAELFECEMFCNLY